MQVGSANEDKTSGNKFSIWEILLKEKFLKRFLFLCLLRCHEKSCFVMIAYQKKNHEAVASHALKIYKILILSTVFLICRNIHLCKFANSGGPHLTLLMCSSKKPLKILWVETLLVSS